MMRYWITMGVIAAVAIGAYMMAVSAFLSPIKDEYTIGDAIKELHQAWCDDPRGTLPDGSCEE